MDVDVANESLVTEGISDKLDRSTMQQNALFSGECGQPAEYIAIKEDRQMRNGRRFPKTGNILADIDVVADGTVALNLSSSLGKKCPLNSALFANKNTRRRRNFKGRGEPKKGGGGGKGIWGKIGSELYEVGFCNDVKDPNYDSESQDEYKLEEVDPELTERQLDAAVKPTIEEYFEHGNTNEVEDLLLELNIGSKKPQIIKLVIMMAMDRHSAHRELTSRLISDLYRSIFTQEDVARGFDSLLAALEDLMLDTPDAHNLLGQFIARCVADDCLAPKFILSYKGRVNSEFVKVALEKAEVLLSMNHGIAHLDNIWGCGGGNRPVILLTNKIVDLLREYICSGDITEAQRCLLDLEVPHFHHELVYQACDLAIEDSSERVMDMVVNLLKNFTSSLVVTSEQFYKGMKRLFHDIDEICVDVPAGYSLLEKLVGKLRNKGVIGDDLVLPPARSRRRFVSEGDALEMRKGHGLL